jgi:DNA-binding NarL/FixJ family response regulator
MLANSSSKQYHPKKAVLIVDDIPQVRQDLHQLLELTGLFSLVTEACNGPEAIRLAGELSPDAIVLDLDMTDLDGYETTRVIKEQNPSTRVIILSAYGGHEEIMRARAVGVDGYVLKGERYEILVDAILGNYFSPSLYNFEKGE